jgi:hypothetical protein
LDDFAIEFRRYFHPVWQKMANFAPELKSNREYETFLAINSGHLIYFQRHLCLCQGLYRRLTQWEECGDGQ